MKISVLVLVADMLVLIYQYRYLHKYRLGEYIGIGIGWSHIDPTLLRKHTINQKDIFPNYDSFFEASPWCSKLLKMKFN